MTGRALYEAYCRSMATLPSYITKGEALPAWEFVHTELQLAWNNLGGRVNQAPAKPKKPTARKKATRTVSKKTGLYGGGDK